jgi:pseudolysin
MKINYLLWLSAFFCVPSFSATPMDFPEHSLSELQAFALAPQQELRPINQSTDFNQTRHVRLQQIYHSYPVWGGDIAVHFLKGAADKNTFATGRIYRGLNFDLRNSPDYIFSKWQADKALQYAITLYQKKVGRQIHIESTHVNMIIYVDEQSKAHWAFLIKFSITADPLARPAYILDAFNFTGYRQWDEVQNWQPMLASGYGGNQKTGKNIYEKLNIERDMVHKTCYLKNDFVTVKDAHRHDGLVKFKCEKPFNQQNNLYWDGDVDGVNGGFSPANDALHAGQIVQMLYQSWYHIPVLSMQGERMHLNLFIHKKMENAYWNGEEVIFGDGGNTFYPLVSISIAAHEISHGFTQQHSQLINFGEAGGINESFSDMAAAATEFYVTNHNTWKIGSEVLKQPNKALRYLDTPTLDCEGRTPGNQCSIEHIKDYNFDLDTHFSSGLFNKAFYLIATASLWDTKKAFDVMVQANRYYWTPLSSFETAACGVVKATRDYGYELGAVLQAFKTVGIKVTHC